ncbi:MAG: efflux RND transporter permease subunit [Treponema sp.]|jgi:multidrug efflux pump subunit AcrB|nr:efflux RND transporter permease subunit [Treponema sp.]
MKGLINLFVRRPVTVIMILAAQIIAAVFSLFTLPVNRLPEFSVPRVTVETVYPGMAANEIRTLVTIPLEDGLSPVKGLEKMRSVSRDSHSLISMDFRWGTDPMAASVLVREAIDAVYPGFPEGVRKPTVTAGDSSNEPHAVIAVSSHNGNAEFARKLAEYELRARLRRIDGAGSVVLVGGEVIEQRLSLDTPRLAALGLAPSEFASLLAQETADIPAGNAREGNVELVVISSGRPESTAALAQIVLPVANGTLTVGDAGHLNPAAVRRESIFVYNGKEATALEIYRRPGSDPLKLSREIRKTVDEAVSLFSRDAQIEIVSDSTPSLISGIISLLISAALGALAVIFVLLIYIRRLKYSLLVSLSIPVSAAAGICVLSVTGKSLNSMSLGGLAMGIGLVSDISVIVLDLLHRTFGKRDTVPGCEETGNKASSIAGSSIASTLTTALVFVPIILLPGPLGSLFGDIAISLTASVAAGWFYAQFCLPSLYRMFFDSPVIVFNTKKENENTQRKRFLNKILSVFRDGSLEKKYSRTLMNLLHRPDRIFTVAALLVAVGICTLLTRPVVFVNPDEAEEVWISAVFPSGSLLETAVVTGISITNSVSALPSVKTVYGRAGAEEEDVGRRADIDYIKEELVLRCVLEKEANPVKALAEINAVITSAQQYREIPFSVYFPKDRTEVLLGLSTERTFVIRGKDRDELLERVETAQDVFKDVSISVNLRPRGQRPELRLYPNREAAAFLSIPAAQIAETLYVINEGIVAARLEIEGRPLDVRVTGQNTISGILESDFKNPSDLVRQLEQIPLKTPQGKTVYLGSLGRIERMEKEASLARLDRSDVIYTDILTEKKIPSQVKEIAERFSWFTGVDDSVFNRYRNSLLLYVILVLILLYMTMGAQFESFLLPLILMMSIPLSLAGAGPALLITGAKIDSGAVLGLTALFGLVVNNSLVLFEISDEKIRCGLSPTAAVYCGARERFQAILITTATTVFALFPLVISPLGNSQKSMAAAMLGGLAASTLLSLFAIPPVLIRFFKWKRHSEERK